MTAAAAARGAFAFVTESNGDFINVSGTSLQGYIDGSKLGSIVRVFGPPGEGFDKTVFEWRIKFDDGMVATIYDYKSDPWKPEHVGIWHVGGHSPEALERILVLIGDNAATQALNSPRYAMGH